MQSVTFTEAQTRLGGLMDAAKTDGEPIAITRNGDTCVLLSAGEYAAIQETLHLLSTPANAERIRQGLDDFAAGKFQPGELCD